VSEFERKAEADQQHVHNNGNLSALTLIGNVFLVVHARRYQLPDEEVVFDRDVVD
jgi:hypothetical protein